MTEKEQQIHERGYIEGERRVYLNLLGEALKHLGYDSPEANANRWAMERGEVVATLRRLCEELGDSDWPDELHLSDVIEKHLACYFEAEGEDE